MTHMRDSIVDSGKGCVQEFPETTGSFLEKKKTTEFGSIAIYV